MSSGFDIGPNADGNFVSGFDFWQINLYLLIATISMGGVLLSDMFWMLVLVSVVAFFFVRLIGRALENITGQVLVSDRKSDNFAIGFFITVSLISAEAIFLPPSVVKVVITSTLILGIALAIVSFSLKREWRWIIPSSMELILLGLLVMLWVTGNAYVRYHASPDVHGLAASTGWLGDNPSFQFLQSEFMRFTGADRPEMYGQATRDLLSTWNIPDARLRFASDHILTVGRVGTALQLALLGQFLGQSVSFPFFVISLGAISVWLISIYSVQAFKGFVQFLYPEIQSKKNLVATLLAIFFFMLSPMALLMLLEGAIPQLLTFAAISWAMAYGLSVINSSKRHKVKTSSLLMQGIAPFFTACVYPQGLLIILPVVALPLLMLLISNKWKISATYLKYCLWTFLGLLPSFAVTYVVNKYTFVRLATEFLTLATGSPYNPGYVTLFSAIFQIRTGLRYELVSGPGGGFASSETSAETALLQLALMFMLFVGFFVYQFVRNGKGTRTVRITVFIFVTVLVWSAARLLLLEIPVSTYFYARALQTFMVVGLPLLLALMVSPKWISTSTLFSNKLKVFIALGLILTAAQTVGAYKALDQFSQSSEQFKLNVEHGFEIGDSESTIVITENPDHRIFFLTLSGPLFYFTDTWNPRLYNNDVKESEFNVVFVDLQKSPATSTLVGQLKLPAILDGPLYIQDLMNLKGFTANSAYAKTIESLQ